MNVELAKNLIDHEFFSSRKEESSNLLREKLTQLMRMYLEKDEKEKCEGEEFFVQLTKDGLIYKAYGKTSQGYQNIGAKESGWDWNLITGPNTSSEYCYSNFFNGHSTEHFESAYAFYFHLFREMRPEGAKEIVERMMACKEVEEMQNLIDRFVVEVLSLDEIMENIRWLEEESFEGGEVDELDVLKMLVLCGYYLYHYIDGTRMEEDLLKKMNDTFFPYFAEEDMDAQDYMDSFLDTLEEELDCSIEGKRLIMDLIFNVHFSYSVDAGGQTPTLYFYKSYPLLEYKKLREQCSDTELVAYLDKLVPMLEDPAFMFPGDTLDYFFLESDSCVVSYGYTKQEYVCAYYYYDNSWEDKEDFVKFDFAFSVARKCFEVLLAQLKAEMSNQVGVK